MRPPAERVNSGRTLTRGLEILFEVIDSGQPVSVTELSTRTGLHKATVSRMLATLAEEDYVTVDLRTGLYLPGSRVASRLRTSRLEEVLQTHALPVMTELRDESSETVALYVPVWPDRVCIAEVASRSGLRRTHAPGECWPLTVGATGLVYLAHMPEDEVERVVKARPLRGITATQFKERIARVRRSGVAISRAATHIPGMLGMAAAILSSTGRPVAMLTVSGPMERWNTEAMERFAPRLRDAASRISRLLGHEEGGTRGRKR